MTNNSGNEYGVHKEDVMRMAELAGMEFIEHSDEEDTADTFDQHGAALDSDAARDLLHDMAEAAFSDDADSFARYAHENRSLIREAAQDDPEVAEMLVLGYRFGISRGSGACMNDLGALYYLGNVVEQDYAKAAELYEMALNHGCFQSVINLGYIYEYGRTGKADHDKAYRFYALAAALAPSSEAVYKLGDMYSRGKAVEKDLAKAHMLWERSLDIANGIVEAAQPSIRIAKLLIDPACGRWGIKPNPLRALSLFQQAEIGLRIDIDDGQTYYKNRLSEAIEGQARARDLVENPPFVLYE